jgi:cysteine-rich repeat protein
MNIDYKSLIAGFVLFFIYRPSLAQEDCFNVPITTPPSMPLCGNGFLDPGEICDDGNRIGEDGCNAWCSAFDAMTSTCTLAGKNTNCPLKKTIVGAPAESFFCDLRCIDASNDGKYLILADGGTLLKMSLFTDQVSTSVSILPTSDETSFGNICSLGIFNDDSSILVRECEQSQKIYLVSPDGYRSTLLFDLNSEIVANTDQGIIRSYYDKNQRKTIFAGITKKTNGDVHDALSNCISVYSIRVETYANIIKGNITNQKKELFASIPCVAYNVVVNDAEIYPSFSIQGMQPKAVLLEPCLNRHQLNSMCYVVYMERIDMQFLRAYIPQDGGLDIAYAAFTNLMDNAMGHPIVRYGSSEVNKMTYTLNGACFQADNTIYVKGSMPPSITLGNVCKNAPMLGMGCSTPLNNPFITSIITSPYLLPEGLLTTHTHNDLSHIFSLSRTSALNNISSGPMIYKSILQSTYANTTPVDFVELPGIMDIVYITKTSVGLISSKRFVLEDRNNIGYCRATNIIYCKDGYFGTVELGVCYQCTNASSPGYQVSVAWQIKCAATRVAGGGKRRLLAVTESTPYERFSVILTGDITEDHIRSGLTAYQKNKGINVSLTGMVTPIQQYNMAADTMDSGLVSTGFGYIQTLIKEAEARTGKTFSRVNPRVNSAEYSTTWVSSGTTSLLAASEANTINNNNKNLTEAEQKALFLCRAHTRTIRGALSCLIPQIINNASNATTGTRRLLQQQASTPEVIPNIVEHQGLTLGSSTAISWNNNFQNEDKNTNINTNNKPSSNSDFPLWLGIGIGVASGIILILLLYILYYRRIKVKKSLYMGR